MLRMSFGAGPGLAITHCRNARRDRLAGSTRRQRPVVGHFFVEADGLRVARQLADRGFNFFTRKRRRVGSHDFF